MDDYYKTAHRMWEDANLLKNSVNKNSWFNCCYLSGYILECYGKLLLLSQGRSGYGHRILEINEDINNYLLLNPALAKYCLDFNVSCSTIFNDPQKWNPKNRYEGNGGIWDTEEIATKFINEAELVISKINELKMDGVI